MSRALVFLIQPFDLYVFFAMKHWMLNFSLAFVPLSFYKNKNRTNVQCQEKEVIMFGLRLRYSLPSSLIMTALVVYTYYTAWYG